MELDRDQLPARAKFWAIHCSINALPSFLIATLILEYWQHWQALLAMLSAILVFIAAYTLVTSLKGPFANPESLLSRALKIGARIRLVMSLVSLPFLIPSPLSLFVPDVWAGMLAAGLVNSAGQALGTPDQLIGAPGLTPGAIEPGFFPVFATTLVEGLILSFLLLMISFFSLLVLQMGVRSKLHPPAAPK